jgi:diguanylate cyclase (GGDEF)-like protein
MELGNVQTLERLFHDVMVRDKSLASVAVRRSDGLIMAQAGDHASAWAPAADGSARLEHLQVPLAMNGHDWGGVEVSYVRPPSNSFWQWLGEPSVLMVLLLGAGSFAAFTLYLRRVLSLLDPSAVIPERVRSAFDVFSGGVMIIDPACRLMMVNSALRNWMGGEADQALSSRAVETLDWFKSALSPDRNLHPWVQAMASGVAAQGAQLEFKLASGEPLRAVVNASPILDGTRKLRGCLVTFENVTPLHNLNLQLVKSMAELEESKREVEKKNDALQELATRDPLTGCLNRRALFSRLERLFLEAREKGHPLCCIMSDIDHFKQFNDRHGHAVGDQVLQAVTRSLGSALREVDLLARYGGEEFCIVLPDADLEQACAVAERLRTDVQGRAGQSIRSTSGLEVTSSFGVSVIDDGIVDPAQLIDRADKALYAAKEAGRNCVMTYQASALDDAALAEPVLH